MDKIVLYWSIHTGQSVQVLFEYLLKVKQCQSILSISLLYCFSSLKVIEFFKPPASVCFPKLFQMLIFHALCQHSAQKIYFENNLLDKYRVQHNLAFFKKVFRQQHSVPGWIKHSERQPLIAAPGWHCSNPVLWWPEHVWLKGGSCFLRKDAASKLSKVRKKNAKPLTLSYRGVQPH